MALSETASNGWSGRFIQKSASNSALSIQEKSYMPSSPNSVLDGVRIVCGLGAAAGSGGDRTVSRIR